MNRQALAAHVDPESTQQPLGWAEVSSVKRHDNTGSP